MRPASDQDLVHLADVALEDSARRSGHWLACRSGCSSCCVGVFSISPLDKERLREGMHLLTTSDPDRAQQVSTRVQQSLERLQKGFPGDFTTGEIDVKNPQFENFGNDEPCPVLNPETGTCDLYAHRPMTCRIFGPPVRNAEGIGMCELCFVGADTQQIEAALMDTTFLDEEDRLNQQFGTSPTLVALALRKD